MTIAEMHVWFRQYAQQMGMQNVRAILPEQIDVLINTSISDTVNQLVRENIGIRNDRVITDNSKIGQINALRSLYKVTEVKTGNGSNELNEVSNSVVGEFECTNFITEDDDDKSYAIDKFLYLVDLSVSYNYNISDNTPKRTRLFPVRIIEDAYLADTFNDFILKPRVRTPVAVIYQNKLHLYLGDNYNAAGGQLKSESVDLYGIRVSYIAAPDKVKYVSDVTGDTSQDVNCDLPESMHIDILKHAVDLYNVSVNGGLYNAQQNQQINQREMSRNEARPINDGYQN